MPSLTFTVYALLIGTELLGVFSTYAEADANRQLLEDPNAEDVSIEEWDDEMPA